MGIGSPRKGEGDWDLQHKDPLFLLPDPNPAETLNAPTVPIHCPPHEHLLAQKGVKKKNG